MKNSFKGLLALGFCATALPAQADCIPNNDTGLAFDCTGIVEGINDDRDGAYYFLYFSDPDGAQIVTDEGPAISLTGSGVILESDTGTVTSAQGDAVEGGPSFTFNIFGGTFSGGEDGIDVDGFGNFFVEAYDAEITAGDTGIRNEDGEGAAVILIDGTLSSGGDGVTTGDRSTAYLDGSYQLDAGGDGIRVGEESMITVQDGSRVESTGGNGIAINSGSVMVDNATITSATGAGIYVGGGSTDDLEIVIGNPDESFQNDIVSGATGILVESGADANLGNQIVTLNQSTLEGTGGVAADLGAGDDVLRMFDASILGDVYMGSGDDVLDFELGFYSAVSGGLFDGGDGFDAITFSDLDFADAIGNTEDDRIFDYNGNVLDVSYQSDSISLVSFETFRFADGDRSIEEFIAALGTTPEPGPDPDPMPGSGGGGTPTPPPAPDPDPNPVPVAPVPLPASAWLLLAALAGLGVMRRRA